MNEKVIELIRKLQAVQVSRGATPAEAARAAMHAQRLLEKHQLSLLDIEANTFDEDLTTEELPLPGQVRWNWFFDLANAVCYPLDCQYIISRRYDRQDRKRHLTLKFVGYDSDAKVARYLFTYLSRVLQAMADRDGRAADRRGAALVGYRKAFMSGAAAVIYERLMEQKLARQQESNSRALVLVKQPKVDEFFSNQFPDVEIFAAEDPADAAAVLDGRLAFKKVELDPALEEQEEREPQQLTAMAAAYAGGER